MVRFYVRLFFIFLMLSCSTDFSKSKLDEDITLVHKIDLILSESEKQSTSDSVRFNQAIKALKLAEKYKIDSLIAKSSLQLVKLSYPLKVKDRFLYFYPKSLAFSKRIRDTLNIAQTHNFTAFFYLKHNIIDSAYYHFYQGSKYFGFLNDNYQTGKMLLNMAIIQKNKRDYKGCEEVTNKALKYLEKTDRKKFIASAYNNIGIVNDEQKKISVAIEYHKKALFLFKKIEEEPVLTVESFNNIAAAYKDNNDYKNAFIYFDSIQPYKKLLENHPIVRARVIDNLAHTRLLSGNIKGVLKDMKKALSIRRQENHLTGIMVSLLHLSEYYRFTNDTEKSFQYALEAKNLSGKYQNLRDVLKALRILTLNELSIGNTDFIEEYHATIDEVERVENSVADEFARIRYEADVKEQIIQQKNKELERKSNLNHVSFLMFAIILSVLLLVFIYKKRQKSRLKKELEVEFDIYLKKKYQLTSRNLEFWKSWVTKNTQKEVAEVLSISIDAIKSRRKALKEKVNKMEKIHGDFNKSKAIIIYNRELSFYKNNTKSKK